MTPCGGRVGSSEWKALAVAHATRSALPALVEGLMRNPYVTARSAETATGLSNQGAGNLIRRAEDLGWLEHLGARGRGGQESWVASRILDAHGLAHDLPVTGGSEVARSGGSGPPARRPSRVVPGPCARPEGTVRGRESRGRRPVRRHHEPVLRGGLPAGHARQPHPAGEVAAHHRA